jgi:hypothetical protein
LLLGKSSMHEAITVKRHGGKWRNTGQRHCTLYVLTHDVLLNKVSQLKKQGLGENGLFV